MVIDHAGLLFELEMMAEPDADIMFEVCQTVGDKTKAFKYIIATEEPPRIFDFLKSSQFDFSLDEYLATMMAIDAKQTIDYLYQRKHVTVINVIMETLENNRPLKHRFLDLVFQKDREWGLNHHDEQI